MSIKLLLDTDIGSDIDDAVCLAYLLAQPECELLGITTVTGEADKFRVDPEIPYLLKGLTMMCGLFTDRFPGVGPLETNAKLDPHATAIVYRSAVSVHRSVGLDVTHQVTMAARQVKEKFRVDFPPSFILHQLSHIGVDQ